jgi:IclR family acetate operon transcriptional repressor
MATMAAQGFVVQDPTTRAYCIGPQAFAVGASYAPHAVLNTVARPIMEELTARCGHASYLGVLAGQQYMIIVAVESRHSLRVTIDVGERRHLHTGAIGKVLLAGMDDAAIRALVGAEPLPRLTPQTITSMSALLAEVHVARRDGVAFNRGEAMVGTGSVAVGVTDRSAQLVAGLGIVYPQQVVADDELQTLTQMVVQAGAAMSTRLGSLDV